MNSKVSDPMDECMTVTTTDEGGASQVVINVRGRFDFSKHREFREIQADLRGTEAEVVVDFADAQYMDSSALGMLLMLRESVGGENAEVTLRNCDGEIQKILAIANFQKLFTVN
tara:strand:- start:385 stop:726 length:342 start_codon:yes stop_codon:yes gene_type:complete